MGLQVRIRHALGERVLELPARDSARPLVVGRGGDADVQLPSIHVGLRHLHLFVQNGQWVATDGPGKNDTVGTTVNGTALKGVRPILSGDVLSLGVEAEPPTIEVNIATVPAAMNATVARPSETSVSAPSVATRPVSAPVAPSPGARPVTPLSAAAGRVAPQLPEVIVESEDETDSGRKRTSKPTNKAESVASEPATPKPATTKKADGPRHPPRSSPVVVGVSMVAAVAIVTSAVVFVYIRKHQPQQTVVTVVQEVARPQPQAASNPVTTKPAAQPASEPDIAPPPPPSDITEEIEQSTTDSTAPETRRTSSPDGTPDAQFFGDNLNSGTDGTAEMSEEQREWKRVESAYYHPNIAKSLLTFDTFAEKYPDTNKEQVAKYREDMLDKLWWTRIEGLIEKRKQLTAELKKTQADVKAEKDEPFRKTVLEPRLDAQRKRLTVLNDVLRKDMNYPADAVPPIGREDQLKAFRERRDSAKFEAWKKTTLKHIRDNHGTYPWSNEE